MYNKLALRRERQEVEDKKDRLGKQRGGQVFSEGKNWGVSVRGEIYCFGLCCV